MLLILTTRRVLYGYKVNFFILNYMEWYLLKEKSYLKCAVFVSIFYFFKTVYCYYDQISL